MKPRPPLAYLEHFSPSVNLFRGCRNRSMDVDE